MKNFLAACAIALIAPLPVWAADCQQDTIQRLTRSHPDLARYVVAAAPVIWTASGMDFTVVDQSLLNHNQWQPGDRLSVCPDARWPNFLAVTNIDRNATLFFLILPRPPISTLP